LTTSSEPLVSAQPLQCGRFTLRFDRPLVMGILNVTPDSFSDGGRFLSRDAALARAEQMIADGADMIDIGGESTRPGAPPVSLDEELARVVPIVEALHAVRVPISVDTYKPAAMRAVLDAGADMINDIWGFRQEGAIEAVAGSQCGLCVMHMLGEPRTMQLHEPVYDDVVASVRDFFVERVAALNAAGVSADRVSLDPGYGFGKTIGHNYTLLAELPATLPHGTHFPLLAGMSRKSMLGGVTGRGAGERLPASLAAAVCAAERGAAIIRVHDVAETVDALKVWRATKDAARRGHHSNRL